MTNQTMIRFGHPGTLVHRYEHWSVLVRNEQLTACSLVIAAHGEATRLSELEPEAFAEFGTVVADVEQALDVVVAYDKINYLMLMMVDPHVHYHVLPRHAAPREIAGIPFSDPGWPKAPDLAARTAVSDAQLAALTALLRRHWPSESGQ